MESYGDEFKEARKFAHSPSRHRNKAVGGGFTGPGDDPMGGEVVLGMRTFRSPPNNACVRDCIDQLTNEQRTKLSFSVDDPDLWRAPNPWPRFIPLALEVALERELYRLANSARIKSLARHQ